MNVLQHGSECEIRIPTVYILTLASRVNWTRKKGSLLHAEMCYYGHRRRSHCNFSTVQSDLKHSIQLHEYKQVSPRSSQLPHFFTQSFLILCDFMIISMIYLNHSCFDVKKNFQLWLHRNCIWFTKKNESLMQGVSNDVKNRLIPCHSRGIR